MKLRARLGNITQGSRRSLSSATTVGLGDCDAFCAWMPIPDSWMGTSCSDCAGLNTTPSGAVDTSDVNNLPPPAFSTPSQVAAQLNLTNPVSVALACPTGYTCTYLAGIPDPVVYAGGAFIAIAAFMLLKGMSK